MAATTAAFAATSGSVAVAATSRGDASRLSSGSAFRTSSMVQFAPLRSKRSNGVVAARAAVSDESKKSIQRDVIVTILAAGTALGLSISAVDGAFANPIAAAKGKSTTALNSAKNAVPNLPSAPNPGGAVDDAKKGVENVASDLMDRADGIFGKGKLGPMSRKSVASTNAGTGSAIGDAKERIANFGKNPIAENIQKGSDKTASNIASISPKPNSQRVDEATEKVGKLGSDLQNKGSDAISEGKGFLGDKAQGSVPNLPDVFPKMPETPDLKIPSTGKLEELKSGVQSKVEGAKSAAASAIGQ